MDKSNRFLGLELSGPRHDRTALCVMDYFQKSRRLAVVDVYSNFKSTKKINSDQKIISQIKAIKEKNTQLATQAPTSSPPEAFLSQKKNPCPKKSTNKKVQWMHDEIPQNKKQCISYLDRPLDIYLKYICKEHFESPSAFGSNKAPLYARMHFLKQHIEHKIFECPNKLALQRISRSLALPKNIFEHLTTVETGIHYRKKFFEELQKKMPELFIYQNDLEKMTEKINSFYAFISAFCLYLNKIKECEAALKNYPRQAIWPLLPKKNLQLNI